ncbi:Glycosyltransferase like family 2 [Rhizoctonia solani]|uniref:chitin synthase n=1 Tax=Rhizoctonia solani TaxID=456999 RepID=A0A8H7M6D7_9AGAM|nr:Glycosyltransferase like family 2 [Rhizoctonia solani]
MAARDALVHSESILTQILTTVLAHSPNLRIPLLAECGRPFHNAAANVLFKTFLLSDSDEASNPVVRNPARYASRIKTLVVVDPPRKDQESTLFELDETGEEDEDEEVSGIRPLSGGRIRDIFSTHTPHLKRFAFAPTSAPRDNTLPLKWDAPSLSVLPPLAHLRLTRLSQSGASALASHPPEVQHLELDFVWLDDWVCERLARMPRVKRMTISTGGTKLTDRGVSALVEGCETLEVLELVEVQVSLVQCRTFAHAAYTENRAFGERTASFLDADHLLSLPCLVGLNQLTTISITRTYNGYGPVDDVALPKPVPREVVEAFASCDKVKHLECDWWAWGIDELKELVEGCVNLEASPLIRRTEPSLIPRIDSTYHSGRAVCATALAHVFVRAPCTSDASVCLGSVDPCAVCTTFARVANAGGVSARACEWVRNWGWNGRRAWGYHDWFSNKFAPVADAISQESRQTRASGPFARERESGDESGGGCGNTNEVIIDSSTVDTVVPPLRDVRKFMRRCPKLVLLEWFGRTGRGAWVAHREDAKSVAGIKVEYKGVAPWTRWTGPEAEAAAEAVRNTRPSGTERLRGRRRRSVSWLRRAGSAVRRYRAGWWWFLRRVEYWETGNLGGGRVARAKGWESPRQEMIVWIGKGLADVHTTQGPFAFAFLLSVVHSTELCAYTTTRPPPNRAPTRTGPSLKRGKTLTRPERGVAPAPLINPPAPLLPAPGAQKVVVTDDGLDVWVIFSRTVTFWAPGFLLASMGGMKDPAVQQAWREKVALCIIAAIMGGVVGFATIGLERVLCPESAVIKPGELARVGTQTGTLGVAGQLVNISGAVSPAGVDFFRLADQLSGQDITTLFTRTANEYTNCRGATFAAATDNPCPTPATCPIGALNQQTFQSLRITNTSLQVGYDWEHVTSLTNFLVIDGAVLNFKPYMDAHPNAIQNDSIDKAIRTVLRVRPGNSGKDATRLFTNRADLQAAIPCTERYYAGRIDKLSPGCFVSSLFLYISLIVIMSIVLVRFAMACIFNWFLSARMAATPKNSVERSSVLPSCLKANLAVDSKNGTAPWSDKSRNKLTKKTSSGRTSPSPGVPEGESSLRTTLDSISATNFSDDRKLLFVIADGMVTGAGEKMSTPDVCVSLLEADPRFGNPVPMGYDAIGSGAKKANRAMVYAGHYTKAGRRTPTVIVVKCGTESEAASDKKPGNRGKRDSQLILMNFFSRVTYNDRMTPLDFDLFRKIHVLMGVTPDFFEVCLMVDADTKVFPDSLKQLVNCMHHDNYIMGVCGETRIANKRESWVTAIQVYEYFISHHLAKAFESVFGGVTLFARMFLALPTQGRKADDDDWVPLLVKPEIVREYSQSEVHTLHQKNLLLLARCRTVVPDTFKMLLSQRRRWINSTMHNLMELVRVRNLCGTFCFSMQFVVFMDLIGTTVLPIAIILTYVLIVTLALDPPNTFEKAIPLILLCTVIGLPAFLILITTRKVVYVFWMGIYLLALPIWNLVLPVYAYWHFDDFSWGETREGKDTGHGDGGGVAAQVPLRRWEDWERSRLRKLKREEKRRREMERAYANYPGNTLRAENTEYYDGASDTVSVFAVPPPPNTLRRLDMGSDSGLDSPAPGVRYQLADSNGYSPVMRGEPGTPVADGQSSALYERGHAKRRSGNRHLDGEYGPLGPLGPPR